MADHPEQELINILISSALAGVDPEIDPKGYDEYVYATKTITPEGYKEYQKQYAEVWNRYVMESNIMDNAQDPGTRH